MKNTLEKKERLKSKKLIKKLFEDGNAIKKFPLRLIYLSVGTLSSKSTQVSFSVPKRNFKKAVDRNRIKRLLREAYRQEKNEILDASSLSCVFMITYIGKTEPLFSDIQKTIREVLTSLNQKIQE
jgi:ribonuclease P protein component